MNEYTYIETISPEKAQEYLTRNKSNRPVNNGVVDFYAEQMKAGNWRLNGQGISFFENGNLSDGQHRLLAIIKSGVSIRINVTRGVANDCFPTYDQGRNRNARDIFSIAEIKNAGKISSCVRNYILNCNNYSPLSAISTNRSKGKQGISISQLLDTYNSHPIDFQTAVRIGERTTDESRLIHAREVSGIIAYLHIALGHNWETCEQFFDAIDREGVSTDCNSVKLLRKILIREKLGTVRKLTPLYKGQLIIKAWNDMIMGHNTRKALRWEEQREGRLAFATPIIEEL